MVRILTESIITIDDSANRPCVISFHPEYQILASNRLENSKVNLWEISEDNSVNLVNTLGNRNINADIIASNIAFHPSGNFMATGSSRNKKVILWHIQHDFSNVNIVQTLEEHTMAINSIAFNLTGNLMATGSQDYTVRLYHLTFTQNNIQARCINTLTIYDRSYIYCSIPSIIFHPIKNILATACSLMGSFQVPSLKEIKLWEIRSDNSFESCNAECIKSLTNTHQMKSIAFNSTGNLMASGDDNSMIKLWHITDDIRMTRNIMTIEKHVGSVESVAFHPKQNILATAGSLDKTTILWRISSDELFENCEVRCIIKLKGHTYEITSISFHKLYPFLATCSQDKIKIWKLNEDGEVEERGQVENNNQNRNMTGRRPPRNLNNNSNNSRSNNSSSNNNNHSSNNNYIAYLQRLSNQELVELVIRRPIQNTNNSNYISQVQRLTRQELIQFLTQRQQRAIQRPPVQRELSFNSTNEYNHNPIQQQRETPITIPENLLNPVKNSNNSCPNFNGLYEFIMRQNLSGIFFFIYEGSNRRVIDYGGPTRDVFDKILPVYTKKFFKEIKDNEYYVILREDKDMDTLIRETDQLILLAIASETKIFLKIDPILLSLLVESQQPLIKYFNNNKRKRFSKLYKEFNEYIEHSNNNSRLLRNKNNSKLMETLKNQELKNEKLKKEIEQQIRFRRFAITRGFTNMQQLIHMFNFIDEFYNIKPEDSFITCELKFDVETIIKRIKLYKMIKRNNFDDYIEEPIPLEQYVRLSQNNESVLILNRADDVIMNYPYLIPFLNFILGPESSDADRKLFVVYVSGSSSYTGELKIFLSYKTRVKAGREFHSSTCYKYLELFKNKTQNRHSITADTIRIQLLSDTGFGRE